jgi:hypothetical protein
MIIKETREDFLKELKDFLPKNPITLEIGVEHGHFSKILYEIIQPSEMHLLDPWEVNHLGPRYKKNHMNNVPTAHSSPQSLENIRNKYGEEIKEGRVFIHQGYSFGLYKEFKDYYFDLVYIDGCHLYESVKNDIKNFLPKIKNGGILSGHDYATKEVVFEQENKEYTNDLGFGIMQAVDEFLLENEQYEMFLKLTEESPAPDWAIKLKTA